VGQLNVLSFDALGNGSGPDVVGPAGIAPPGASLAASQQFGTNQTDVFLVDNEGRLNVFSISGSGSWNGPQNIGPVGAAPAGAPLATSRQFGANNQTDVFLVDDKGNVSVFWVQDHNAWSGPKKIS
jgi:PPE-repeat protein